MKQQSEDQVISYSKSRRFMAEAIRSTHQKPLMHGLLEVDVTKSRAYVQNVKARTGESLSFTAFIIACVAQAVDENPSVQACRKGNKHLVVFDDVDVATAIERDMAGQKQPIVYVVKAANKKTFREIHHEIRAAQMEAVEKAWVSFKEFRFFPLAVFRIIWPVFFASVVSSLSAS